jgi:hypothetical protein
VRGKEDGWLGERGRGKGGNDNDVLTFGNEAKTIHISFRYENVGGFSYFLYVLFHTLIFVMLPIHENYRAPLEVV